MSTVLLDVDGPLGAFTEHLFECVGAPARKPVGWDVLSALSPQQITAARYILENPRWWADMPVTKNAEQGVEMLQNSGHRILVVTAPYAACPDWHRTRVRWLNQYFGFHEEQVILAHDKQWAYGDVFIDDKPSSVHNWCRRHRHGKGYLFYREEVPTEGLPQFTWQSSVVQSLLKELEIP